MAGVDYEAWADYIAQILQRYENKPVKIIDLACGTGSSTLPFAARGYNISGMDLSSAMLAQARLKAAQAGLEIDFFKQDLRTFNLPCRFELALLFQDGLNYLLRKDDLASAFSQINSALEPGALFIFDLTRPRLRPVSSSEELNWADLDDFTLIWESSYSTTEDLWSICLTVFYRTENGLYQKFREEHKEKDYCPELVKELLEKAGFTLHKICPSFSLAAAGEHNQKLTFIAEKI